MQYFFFRFTPSLHAKWEETNFSNEFLSRNGNVSINSPLHLRVYFLIRFIFFFRRNIHCVLVKFVSKKKNIALFFCLCFHYIFVLHFLLLLKKKRRKRFAYIGKKWSKLQSINYLGNCFYISFTEIFFSFLLLLLSYIGK